MPSVIANQKLKIVLPYGVAIGSTYLALILSLWLEPFLSRTIGAFFYIAIAVSVWYGGFRAGVVAIVLSILAINYFFLPPYYHFYIDQPINVLQLVIFMFVGLVIVLIASNLVEGKNKIERLSQQLIKENAEQLRIALSAAQMGMWDWNMVTGEIKWSPEHALLFGLNPDAFDGRYETFNACVHPDDRPSLKESIQQALQTQSIYQHEYRVIWPDGSIHWVEGRGDGFYDQTGKALRMTGTIMNIDGRKQTETLLHHQFEQQRLLVEMKERIRQSLNLQDILQTTVEEVREFLQCDRALIFKIDSNYSGTVLVESVAPAWRAISSNHTYDPCIGQEYIEPFEQGLITAKSDIYTAEIAPCHLSMLESFQVRANLVVPILQGENLWGLLVLHHCAAPREWQTSEIELLRQLSAQASIAIQQADLLEQLQTELRERQQAEINLQETQEKLQLFIKYAPASIVMFDRSMCYLAASQRWVDEFQIDDLQSIIGRSHYELFPDLPLHLKQSHQRGLAGFVQKCEEDKWVYPDGSQQWFRWEVHPWYRSNGDVGGIILFSDNITDRKQAQIALQQINAELEKRVTERTSQLTEVNDRLLVILLEKEQAYQLLKEQAQLLDLAHDSIITWDLNSVISFWNQGAELMYGWTKAEAFGQESHSLFKTQFPQPLAEIKAELFETGYWEGELIHCTRDERQITVSSRWVVQKDDTGKPIKILEINSDVTQRKAAELVLQQYIREVEDLYNNAPCGYHSLDAEGTIVRINDTELKWLGYTRDEILHKLKFLDLIAPENQHIFYENFPKLKKQGWIENLEFEMFNKDGSSRWFNLNATAIKDAADNFVMTRSTLFDISDRKQIQRFS
jgi:PAS domain S-box-containing protein